MKKLLIDFLKLLEVEVPPPPNCHHCITYAQYGSDQTGYVDKLALQTNANGVFQCFFLEDADFENVNLTFQIIREFLKDPSKGQIGIGMGQYGLTMATDIKTSQK